MDNNIPDEEFLYRGVVISCWNEKENRPSSAAFKDSNGVSVDRDGGRNDEECINHLLSDKQFKAVCRLTAGDARKCDTVVKYLPIVENTFHSEIHDSEVQSAVKSTSKSRKLKNCAEVVYKNE